MRYKPLQGKKAIRVGLHLGWAALNSKYGRVVVHEVLHRGLIRLVLALLSRNPLSLKVLTTV